MRSGTGHRLPAGGRIVRTRPLSFTFEGAAMSGYAGDTLASALIANGVSTVARSFKYHRRRGVFAAGAEEPNAIVQVGSGAYTVPNLKATQVPLYEGLVARSVNCWPSIDIDLGVAVQAIARFLPAGFYYKTFKWPNWRIFEPIIRRAAGLGTAPRDADPDHYDKAHAHCDVLVVGAGPAGLVAALATGRAGARVILADEQTELGGSLLFEDDAIDGAPAAAWVESIARELTALREVTIFKRTTVFGYYDHNALGAVERLALPGAPVEDARPAERLWKIRARRVILATGAHERPIVFAGNDLPGVMLAAAVRHYIRRYAVAPGSRAVVFTNNDDGYRTALVLADAGVAVAAIVDPRAAPQGALPRQARSLGITVLDGRVVVRARGRARVEAVEVADLASRSAQWIDCDLLAVSGGWTPAVHLHCQSGGRPKFDPRLAAFVPGPSVQAERSVGAAAGVFALGEILTQAAEAGTKAQAEIGVAATSPPSPHVARVDEAPIFPLWQVKSSTGGKAWVDLASDVTADDVALAARENYVAIEHLKRYTTTGMAIDQGKTSNVNALALLGQMTGREIPAVGTTRFRPPYDPVTMGALAGRERADLHRARLRLPMHDWHVAAGAAFEDYGGWQRPTAYPTNGETLDAAIQREARQVRRAVGIFDGSPLGKIEIEGPDAATLLDRIYVGTVSTLAVGRTRYGLMLNENGIIIDDGVVTRAAPNRFIVGTTSAGANRIAQVCEEWLQCEWPQLKVFATPVTHQWAVITLTGPRARDVLAAIGTDIDLAPAAFPHMHFRQGRVGGVAARVFRVSYTGELAFEINVPARAAPALWVRLVDVGQRFDLAPFGVESLMVLRIEKGYLHVGSETDGTTVPDDVGMGQAVARKTSDFIGRRSLSRPEATREGRLQLVGLLGADEARVLPAGAHVVRAGAGVSDGYVTSSCFSPTLGRGVALAMIRDGRRRTGESVTVFDQGSRARARVVAPCFFDPEGKRLDG